MKGPKKKDQCLGVGSVLRGVEEPWDPSSPRYLICMDSRVQAL